MTQWGIASPELYNVTVNSMFRHWILLMVEDGELIQYGLEYAVDWSLGVFYADDCLLVSRDQEWIQGALNVLVGIFWRIGLTANAAKSKMMTCQPEAVRLEMSE